MPKPMPWRASRTPSQSHSDRDINAPTAGVSCEYHGTWSPIPDVDHSIWHHRGAPREMAKMGISHACARDRRPSRRRTTDQIRMKKSMSRRMMDQVDVCWELCGFLSGTRPCIFRGGPG